MSGIVYAAERKEIAVSVDCPEDLTVSHDSKWTSEALFNLLDNAVKYTPPGGKIAVSVVLWEMYVEIKVTDTGKGISESNQAAIFRRSIVRKKYTNSRRWHWSIFGPRDRNAAGRLYQSGFGAGQGFGIFHYATYKIERGGRPFPAARHKFF